MGKPPTETEIHETLARSLLQEQFPDLAGLPLRAAGSGWDNTLFRLGEELAVRLPRRAASAPLLRNEQSWLPCLAPGLPLPVPVPLRVGCPGGGYPWFWSVVPWLRGTPAVEEPVHPTEAATLGRFLAALHQPAPPEAPANPWRGVPLLDRAAGMAARLERTNSLTDSLNLRIRPIWQAALQAPPCSRPTWLHGDLHPRNLLVQSGRLAAVIDWGDLCAGDPATDLAVLWMLFEDSTARQVALKAYGAPDEATLARARGWATLFGLMFLEEGTDGLGPAILARTTRTPVGD